MTSLLTVDELSQYLKINKITIYQWVRKGHIPFVKVRRCVRFRQGEIEAWLAEQAYPKKGERRIRV